jgi:alpha-tubulin suppressor-like RCC1 family protein
VGAERYGPVLAPMLVAVPQAAHIDVGRERSGAVSGDARGLKMWGVGALGHGKPGLSSQPVDVPIDGVAQLAAGYHHTCALRTTGEVLCWGENGDGQLGVGLDVREEQLSPVAVKLAPP